MTTIVKAIVNNSIERLSELYKEWLEEKQKAADESITIDELADFFEYVSNVLLWK